MLRTLTGTCGEKSGKLVDLGNVVQAHLRFAILVTVTILPLLIAFHHESIFILPVQIYYLVAEAYLLDCLFEVLQRTEEDFIIATRY